MPLRASVDGADHPRPTLIREGWSSLDGTWEFAEDPNEVGLAERWWEHGASAFDREIEVPFAPEAPASGIGETGLRRVVWYRRRLTLTPAAGKRHLLHFGAVDREATVWVDGRRAGEHEGGQTAFHLDITDLLDPGEDHVVVVRAFDDAQDVELPHGKQDWLEEPHGIWYHRTTGIWRSVWLETVAPVHVQHLSTAFDMPRARLEASVLLNRRPEPGTTVRITARFGEELLGTVEQSAAHQRVELVIDLPLLRNTMERDRVLWRPGHPALVDLAVEVLVDGEVVDEAASCTGLRTTGVDRGRFLLNGEPLYVRSVLEQGYWEETLFTAPSSEALRREVELILELGFNAARVHQKVADPRFLHWADRLGLMVWGETANAVAFSPRGATALTAEWMEIVEQVRPHPCVVTWVPINESWGVRDLADDAPQRELAIGLTSLTRALDPTRPVVSNDGYELTGGDIIALHDYENDAEVLGGRYADAGALERTIAGMGPQGRRPIDDAALGLHPGAPVMITEFGGVAYANGEGTWGYATAGSAEEYAERVGALFAALHASPVLAGFCYTQITDTRQEANGLATADRVPKIDPAVIRAFVTGRPQD